MLVPPCCYYRYENHRNATTKSYPNLRRNSSGDENFFENLIKKYPDVFQFCCLCLSRKRKAIGCAEKFSGGGQTNAGNGEITVVENGTPIIPITIPPDIDKYHPIDTNVQLESNHQLQQHQQTITENGKTIIGRFSASTTVENKYYGSHNDDNRHSAVSHHQMAYESQTEESREASTENSRNTSPGTEVDDEPDEPITMVPIRQNEPRQQSEPSTPVARPKSVMSEKIVHSEDETDNFKPVSRPTTGRLVRTGSSSTFILDQPIEKSFDDVVIAKPATPKSRPTTAKPPQSPFRQVAPTPSPNPNNDEVSSNSVYSGIDDHEQDDDSKGSKSEFGSNQTLEIAESVMTATPSPGAQNFDDIPIEVHKSNESLANVDTFTLQLAEMPDQVLKSSSSLKRANKLTRSKKVSPTGKLPPMDRMKRPNELFPKSLRRMERPRESLSNCYAQLDSPSWDVTMNGLQTFVRLIRHHPEIVDQQMHLVAIALAKHIKNLRSQVARAACQAAGEFFVTHTKTIEPESEDIAATLLNRTADTNKFLRNDATKALENMCDHLPPNKTIHILAFRGATHPNAVVRSNASKLLARLVNQLGCEKVFSLSRECREKLILTGANLLMEGSLDTRNYTKQIFKILSTHPGYAKILLEIIPPNIYRNIEKTLKSIK